MADININTSISEPSTIAYSLDGGSYTPATGTTFTTNVSTGPHSLSFKAIDAAGNESVPSTLDFTLNRYSLIGNVAGTGSTLSGTVASGEVAGILNQDWGAWNIPMTGTYSGTSSSSWETVAGGTTYLTGAGAIGHWLSKGTGAYEGNTMTGTSSFSYITQTTLGTGTGAITGSHDTSTFNLTDVGSNLTEAPLTFYSNFSADLSYYNGTTFQTSDGSLTGKTGGTGSIWTATVDLPASLAMIGTYTAGTNPSHIWGSDFISYNYTNTTDTTYDGGAYYGIAKGIQIGTSLEGKIVALYISPSGNAGYLLGSMSGTTYPTIGMYEMNGGVYPTQRVTAIGILPANLSSSIYPGTGSGNMSGSFTGGGSLSSTVALYTHAITNATTPQPWGIYNFILDTGSSSGAAAWTGKAGGSGTFGAYYSTSFLDDSGYWIADINKDISGTWSGNRLAGSLSGSYISKTRLGTISGDVLGTYNTDNTWQGVSLGTWEGTLLEFVSSSSSGLGWTDFPAGFHTSGSMDYILGGTTSLFGVSPPLITMIVSYWRDYTSWNKVWWANVSSYNYINLSSTTYDGGAYWGYMGGIMLIGAGGTDTLEGHFYATYIDSDSGKNAGIIKANLSGSGFYLDSGSNLQGMFKMNGTAVRAEFVKSIGISPADLGSSLGSNQYYYYASAASGDITFPTIGTGSPPATLLRNITGQGWGIFQGVEYGGYSTLPSANWTATIKDLTLYTPGRLFETEFTGTQWSGGKGYATSMSYGADVTSTPYTWVSIGDLLLSYDASRASPTQGWQAVHTGVWLETNKFLSMAADPTPGGGNDQLKKLNIPCVEVGMTNLIGSTTFNTGYDILKVNINNTKFFQLASGGPARLWASGDAGGDYTNNMSVGGAPPPSGTLVILSGGTQNAPLSATFTLKTFDAGSTNTNKWLATITNGTGGYNGSTTFKGAAAGTITPSTGMGVKGTFTGTATGTAK